MNKALKEKLIQAAEELEWNVHVDDSDWEFEKYSPAGEDFCFSVSGTDVSKEVMEYYEGFDIEEHVRMWLNAKDGGTRGVPGVKVLVQDADDIDEMLMDLANALHNAEKEWYEENDEEQGECE